MKRCTYGATWVRFANLSDRPVTLNHVSPGVVRSEGKLYDVNSVLDGDALVIEARQAYAFIIEPMSGSAAAVAQPDAPISSMTAAVRGQDVLQLGDLLTPRLGLA